MELMAILNDAADLLGIDYLGVADTAPAQEAIRLQGGEVVASFPRAVSLGIILPHAVVDQLPNRSDKEVALNYGHHAYNVINSRLDLATSRLSGILQREGHRSLPIPAKENADIQRLCASFSHKMGAHLAGLGWIGKSCLLITPEVGPRARWSTVLTDAPLQPTGEPMEERCRDCMDCVDICPVGAFAGRNFCENEPREARYDAHACNRYFMDLVAGGEQPVCGLCIYICPYGRKIRH